MAEDLNENDLQELITLVERRMRPGDKRDDLIDKLQGLYDSLIVLGGTVTTVNFVPAWLDKKQGIYHQASVREARVDVTRMGNEEFDRLFAGQGREEDAHWIQGIIR